MPDDDVDLDAPDETSSEAAPAEETETPSDTGEASPETPADETGEDEHREPPQRTSAWDNFEKKFLHIKDPQERQEAMAAAWWEKNNFASKVRKENESLKRKVSEIESRMKEAPAAPATPPEPEAPPAEIQELDGRIQQLYQQDQNLIKEANEALVSLNEVDTDIAKLTARLEDATKDGDETKQTRFEAQLAAAKVRRDGVLSGYKSTNRERQSIAREYEKVGKERIWLENVLKERASRQAKEKAEREDFEEDFPTQVDRLIESNAERLAIPAHFLEDLSSEVNDGLLVDLWRLGEANLDDVDLPALVKARVQRFAELRNLADRRKFADLSKGKLRVASSARSPAPASPGGAPAPKRPVSPDSMNHGGLGPKMSAARRYLISKGL